LFDELKRGHRRTLLKELSPLVIFHHTYHAFFFLFQKKMRSTFDLDGDGKMTMVEMKKKTEDMMAEMRVSSQRHSTYIRTVRS
jgi:hypothetical protein